MELRLNIIDAYKAYFAHTSYVLNGDLIILSGVNGSGKSQLLKIIANKKESYYDNGTTKYEHINREVFQVRDNTTRKIENIILFSFKDNIHISENFGNNDGQNYANNKKMVWNFYLQNIFGRQNVKIENLIYDQNGFKNPHWRSIQDLYDILVKKFGVERIGSISNNEFNGAIPENFIFLNEDNIVGQVNDLFFTYACEVSAKKESCYDNKLILDEDALNKKAPWTQLNNLFLKLGFKYRFSSNYSFNYSSLSLDKIPNLLENGEVRFLKDLSDGEKTILKLALHSLENELHGHLDVALFDEYDATLNPSLINAFYEVIESFYIKKNIQVIIATHSPVTIALAPDFAKHFEIFNYDKTKSPQIKEVSKFEYMEIKEISDSYYKKIANQPERFLTLKEQEPVDKNTLYVEDHYTNIYKIAYLKLKGINDLTEENLDKLFNENSNFSIKSANGAGNLKNIMFYFSSWDTQFKIICLLTWDTQFKIICLFDFDHEGKRNFDVLAKDKNYKIINDKTYLGLCLRNKYVKAYALLLPIPERLSKYVSLETSKKCLIAVESLLTKEYLEKSSKTELYTSYVNFYVVKDLCKKSFWIDLLDVDVAIFEDFKILFEQIERYFNNEE